MAGNSYPYVHGNGQGCYGCQICWGNELERPRPIKVKPTFIRLTRRSQEPVDG